MRKLLITGIFLLCAAFANAQGARDLVINEVLVNNVNNYEDDYGTRAAWIEFFNAGYSRVDIASCYISLQIGDKSYKYRIPKGDSRTSIAPQGYLVFFNDGSQSKGTFHTNFTLGADLDSASRNQNVTLALIEANGKDTIDKITYNLADQKPDISIGRMLDGRDEYIFTTLDATTPYATNNTTEPVPQHEEFRRTDPIGYGMAITAMSVVFSALLLLYLIFRFVGKRMVAISKRKEGKSGASAESTSVKVKDSEVFSGEIMAAIALALRMYENELHDIESTVLTINKVAKTYSPWSSKIYGLRQMPNKK